MANTNHVTKTAIISAIGLGLTLASTALANPDWAKKGDIVERCLGVGAKGQNDCGSKDGSHSCAGNAKANNDKNEWVYTPEGVCKKLGGKVWKTKKIKR